MPAPAVRGGLIVIAVAIAMVTLLWRSLPASTPPIYDGICIADPYRTLGGSPAPSDASKMYPAGAQSPTDEITTSESPAQAQLLMMMGTFSSPSSPYSVRIAPVQPPIPAPTGYTLDGNVYQLSAATQSGTLLQPTSQNPVTVVMRGTGASSSLTMFVDSGGGWQQLKTFNVGCGFAFEAVSAKLGYFGLFSRGAAGGGGGGQGGGFPIAVVVALVIIVLLVAVIVLVRLNARPQQQPQQRRGRRH